MGSYVLIMTMAVKSAYAGMGGIATQEFYTLGDCSAAAAKWKASTATLPHVDIKELSAICVKR